jgi:hypothetical protein
VEAIEAAIEDALKSTAKRLFEGQNQQIDFSSMADWAEVSKV